MFNNIALDLFISLVFIFLLYSLLATIIEEMIATRLAFRARVLEKAILRMLEDGKTSTRLPYGDRINGVLHIFGLRNLLKGKTVAPWFYAHPLIKYLGEDNYYSKPSYLYAGNFSKVMIDLLKGFGQPESQAVQSINHSITSGIIHKLPINISTSQADKANPAIKVLRKQNPELPGSTTIGFETVAINVNTALLLRSLWQDSGADINTFRVKLEQWFNDTMEHATAWYKRYTRVVLFLLGLIIAFVFNVDTIAIHRILSKDKTAREQLVDMAISDKGKYKNEDDKTNHGTALNDSILKKTYNIVANDAQLASHILGLGRPWKDSCKICDSIYTSGETELAFNRKLDSLRKESLLIDSLKKIAEYLRQDISAKDSTLRKAKPADVLELKDYLASGDSIARRTEGLLKLHNPEGLTAIGGMTILNIRCPYILQQTKNTWFKYSPNQTGGWETLLGWLITALAITLGAPFWFDLLSKLINLKGGAHKIDSSGDNANNKSNSPVVTNPVTVNVNANTGGEAVG